MPFDSEEIDDAGIDNLSNGQVIIGNFSFLQECCIFSF